MFEQKALDNAGARTFKCIHVFGRKRAQLGGIIRMVAHDIQNAKKIKASSCSESLFSSSCLIVCVVRVVQKKKPYFGLLVQSAEITQRRDGSQVRFFQNSVLTLDDKHKFMGTRINGPVAWELRSKKSDAKLRKIVSYSAATV